MTVEFGNLESVDLREAWRHEANDFTPWLADNLDRLSEAVGIPLEREGTEVQVEQFYADILARNPLDDSVVLIENQLEWSDHTHLGQILTYLAGLEARTVIWVARDFEPAHLSAIRWLNENTTDSFAFFAIRVKVVRICDSPVVPIFEILERPSEWDRKIRAIAEEKRDSLSQGGQLRREFWTYYAESYPHDGVRRGFAGHNPDYPIEDTGLKIRRVLALGAVGLWIAKSDGGSSEPELELVEPYLPALATALGLDSERLRTTNYTAYKSLSIDTEERENWPRAVKWLHDQLSIYRDALTGTTSAPAQDSPVE
jgi:hypothetical protein